jgi:hypothetical protein
VLLKILKYDIHNNPHNYTGSLSHLHRLLTKWRHPNREEEIKVELPAEESRAIDPAQRDKPHDFACSPNEHGDLQVASLEIVQPLTL